MPPPCWFSFSSRDRPSKMHQRYRDLTGRKIMSRSSTIVERLSGFASSCLPGRAQIFPPSWHWASPWFQFHQFYRGSWISLDTWTYCQRRRFMLWQNNRVEDFVSEILTTFKGAGSFANSSHILGKDSEGRRRGLSYADQIYVVHTGNDAESNLLAIFK